MQGSIPRLGKQKKRFLKDLKKFHLKEVSIIVCYLLSLEYCSGCPGSRFYKTIFAVIYSFVAQCYKLFYSRNLSILILSQSVCYNRLKKLARDRRSSLLQNLVNYGRKKFYNIGPRSIYFDIKLITLVIYKSSRWVRPFVRLIELDDV